MKYHRIKLDSLRPSRSKSCDFSAFMDHKLIDSDVWLAGGSLRTFITGEKPSDYDIFFRNTGDAWRNTVESTRKRLVELGYTLSFECPVGSMFTYVLWDEELGDKQFVRKVQLICERAFDSMESLIQSFDLAPCVIATDGVDIVFTREFVRSVKFKRLFLSGLTFPVATMGRIYKYMRKGYAKGNVFTEFLRAFQAGAPWEGDSWRQYID